MYSSISTNLIGTDLLNKMKMAFHFSAFWIARQKKEARKRSRRKKDNPHIDKNIYNTKSENIQTRFT